MVTLGALKVINLETAVVAEPVATMLRALFALRTMLPVAAESEAALNCTVRLEPANVREEKLMLEFRSSSTKVGDVSVRRPSKVPKTENAHGLPLVQAESDKARALPLVEK